MAKYEKYTMVPQEKYEKYMKRYVTQYIPEEHNYPRRLKKGKPGIQEVSVKEECHSVVYEKITCWYTNADSLHAEQTR